MFTALLTSLLALSALSTPADACSPGEGVAVGFAPAAGQVDVPVDSVVRVYIGEGYTNASNVSLALFVDGVAVEGTQGIVQQSISEVAQFNVLSFRPDEALPDGAEVGVRYQGKVDSATYSFTVGSESVVPITDAPSLFMMAVIDDHVDDGEAISSCGYERWRELSLESDVSADAAGLALVHLYRVGTDGVLLESQPPFRSVALGAGDTVVNWGLVYGVSSDIGEECFVVAQEDGTGQLSSLSEVACTTDVESFDESLDKSGCSTLGGATGGVWALMLVALGAGRRRR